MMEGAIIDIRAEGFGLAKGGNVMAVKNNEKKEKLHPQKASSTSGTSPAPPQETKWTQAQLWKVITLLGNEGK